MRRGWRPSRKNGGLCPGGVAGTCFAILACVFTFMALTKPCSSTACAQPPLCSESSCPPVAPLEEVIEATLWDVAGTRCTMIHGEQFCRERFERWAFLFIEASGIFEVRADTLAAMAIIESALYPAAVSPSGCSSIMQLHPYYFSHIRFVGDLAYRASCLELPGACQRESVLAAAAFLSDLISQCGSERRAIGAYNSGRCHNGTGYARRVLVARRRMDSR